MTEEDKFVQTWTAILEKSAHLLVVEIQIFESLFIPHLAMLNLHDPLIELKITSAVCSAVAIASTIYRLAVRWGRLWADDAWALFSCLTLCIQVAGIFMHVPNPSELSRTNRVAAYYLAATSFYAIIWSARISIIFSIIRLDPSERRRKRLLYVTGLFFLVWAVLMAQLFWICEREPKWKDKKSPQCVLDKQVAICQLVSDTIADSILLAAPLRILSGLQDKRLRRRLIIIFSTCIVTTIVSLVHAAYILKLGGTKVLIAGIVEDCMSLIVCNVPVVVTAAIRLRNPQETAVRKGPPVSTFLKFATRIFSHKDSTATTNLTTNVTTITIDKLSSRSKDQWSSTDLPKGSEIMCDTPADGFVKGSLHSWPTDASHAV